MKAFFYTLVLTVVLVGSVMLLRSISPPLPEAEPEPVVMEPAPQLTPSVRSEPATLSQLGEDRLDDSNRDALRETGLEMLNLWHVPEATEVFERLVAEDSTDVQALLVLAVCYSHPLVAREEVAARCWRRARDTSVPSLMDSLVVRAVGNIFVHGLPDAGVTKLRRVEKLRGRSVDTGLYLAVGLIASDRAQEAVKVLEELLEGDTSLGRVRETLILAKAKLGLLEEAEALSRGLAALYPEEPYPYVLLARVLLMRGKLSEAAEFSNNALLLDERYIPAIVMRAHLYVAEGQLEAARVSFEKLLLFGDPMLSSFGMESVAYVDFLAGRFDDGADAMDEAVRLAMGVGSTWRGLLYAFRLVDYLCELGRLDAAIGVLGRWVSNRGKIPEQLGEVRVRISAGDHENARRALQQIKDNGKWRAWMRRLALDYPDTEALTYIQSREFDLALRALQAADEPSRVGARRPYLKGFANFEVGNAEVAGLFFDEARMQLNVLEFPYHGDPILYTQSIFFQAETAIARGESERARAYYEEFLAHWGDASWELQAVDRARDKLATLAPSPPEG